MKKRYPKPKPVECPHNEGVACLHTADCEICGWNPDVAVQRLEYIKSELGIEDE